MRNFDRRLNRRSYLAAAGATIALPFLDSLPVHASGVFTTAAEKSKTKPDAAVGDHQRLVCMGVSLGMYPQEWNPKETGSKYTAPKLIKPLEGLRNDFTLISNADHPGVKGGHKGTPAFLSGVYKPERIGQSIVIRNQITFDQLAAKHLGQDTRFQSLQLTIGDVSAVDSLSWNDKGIPLQPANDPKEIFRRLFVKEKNPKARERDMKLGRSVLDLVQADAKALQRELGVDDRDRMDQYLTSVRDVEKRIERQIQWLNKPKPGAPSIARQVTSYHANLDMMLELTAIALQTDSTRVVSVALPGGGPPIETGNIRSSNYHGQSHHGKDPKIVAELIQIEQMHTRSLAKFLNRLKSIPAGSGTLLDKTQVLFGSGLGNGSSHSNRDLPVLIAGGGYRHGQHIKLNQGTPLCNLFVTMLQKMNVEVDSFAGSTGTVNEFLKG